MYNICVIDEGRSIIGYSTTLFARGHRVVKGLTHRQHQIGLYVDVPTDHVYRLCEIDSNVLCDISDEFNS